MFEQSAIPVINNNHVTEPAFQHTINFRLRLFAAQQRYGMPKVVLDQRERYDQNEMFTQLKTATPITYVGYGSLTAPQQRREKLMADLAHRRLEIAFTAVGFSFQLCVTDQCDQQDNTVHLGSNFILDGVCVKFIGELNVLTMEGTGRIEYDQRRAEEENERLLSELEQYRELVASRQRQQSESERSAAAVRSGTSQHAFTTGNQKLQLPGSSQSVSNSSGERRKELSHSQ